MALPIDLSPFVLQNVVSGDNYLTHYNAVGDEGEEYIITEFYPKYMAMRQDSGELVPSDQFLIEFSNDRDDFIQRATALEDIRDASIHPVHQVIEKNNTAYLVRRVCTLTKIESYMSGQQMDYDEAFFFLRPLLLSAAQAAEHDIYFDMHLQEYRVNSFRQVVCCANLNWEKDFHPTLTQLARLYYRLVTGVEPADENAPGFSVYGVNVPTRVDTLIMNVLRGEILYGSLDDFYKTFKSLIDTGTDQGPTTSKTTMAILRGVAAALCLGLVAASVFLVQGALGVYRASSFWADPAIFASPDPTPSPAMDFTQHALIHPRNRGDAINGSITVFDGFMFMRDSRGMLRRLVTELMVIPGAAGVLAAAEDIIIVSDVMPSFIVGHNGMIYFSDMMRDGMLFRSALNGDDFEQVTDFPVLHPTVVGDAMFFAHGGSDYHLYRLNLLTDAIEPIFRFPVFGMLVEGNQLYFLAGEPNTEDSGLYVIDLQEGGISWLYVGVGMGIRSFMETIYFINSNGYIRTITTAGEHGYVEGPRNVVSFDVFFQWVAFTEEGRHVLRAVNTDTGASHTLTSFDWTSYVRIHDGLVYTIDHSSPTQVRAFELPLADV